MLKKIIFGLLSLFIFLSPNQVFAENQTNISCSNRFLTLVNPVRSRQLWVDRTLQPINDQYILVSKNNFPATWLLQDDALYDKELLDTVKKFDNKQEFGLLLEISDHLAANSRVLYPPFVTWYNPRAVFLSGYSQSERRLLIDKMFEGFKFAFGYYPKSVGAWWIDSYSLQYMKDKYNIQSAMIVADQKNTDNYGVWGQWWSVPYYPSKANILAPASSVENKQPVVVLQWAQRDPVLAYGSDFHSSYSLQANDYTLLDKDINYFKGLVGVYLDCQNPVGQITIGLETGMESIKSLPEYERQLQFLKTINSLSAVSMSQFAEKYSQIYPEFPKQFILDYQDYVWKLTTNDRSSEKLKERIVYQQSTSFQDYFVPDQKDFLDRILPISTNLSLKESYWPFYIFPYIFWLIFLLVKKNFRVLFVGSLFTASAFGLLLKSGSQFGWIVYYGFVTENLAFWQFSLTFLSFLFIFIADKQLSNRNKNLLYFIPLAFGIDIFLQNLRFSFISNIYYLGFLTDALHFFGIGFEKPFNFYLINKDLPAYQILGLLHFDYNLIWQNFWYSLVAYPLFHILLAVILWYFFKFIPVKIKKVLLVILMLMLIIYLFNIWQANPRAAIISATIK